MNLSGTAGLLGASFERAKTAAKRSLVTAAIAILGALVLACAAGFAAGAAYIWLALHLPDYVAALCVAVALLVTGIALLVWVGGSRDVPARQARQPGYDNEPTAEIFRQTTAAMTRSNGSTSKTMLTAAALGVVAGLMATDKGGQDKDERR